jgi:hypothetical protein
MFPCLFLCGFFLISGLWGSTGPPLSSSKCTWLKRSKGLKML